MRHAALATPTILSTGIEYPAAILLAVAMLIVGFFVFRRVEEGVRLSGSIATS
jgi:hypothetical protein